MIRLVCPVCGGEQETSEGREFVFCKFCGTHMNVALVAAETAAAAGIAAASEPAAAAEAAADAVQPAAFAPQWPVMETQPVRPAAAVKRPAPESQAADPAAQQTEAAAEKPKKEKAPKAEKVKKEKAPKAAKAKKKGKGLLVGIIAAVLILGGAAAAYFLLLKPANDYKAAEALMAEGSYAEAIEAYEALGDYKDAKAKIDACLLQQAVKEVESGKYTRSMKTIKSIGDPSLDISAFDKAAEKAGSDLIRAGKIEEAETLLETMSGHIVDLQEAVRERFTALFEGEEASAETYEEAGRLLKSFKDQISDTSFVAEVLGRKVNALIEEGEYAEAVNLLSTYRDQNLDVSGAVKAAVQAQLEKGNYEKAAGLPGLFGLQDLDVSEAVKAACEREMIDGDLKTAADILKKFGLEDLDVSETAKTVFAAAVGERDFYKAEELLERFPSQNIEVGEDLLSAFKAALENNTFGDLSLILDLFGGRITDRAPYEAAALEKMTALVEAGENIEVLDLYNEISGLDNAAVLADAVKPAMEKSVEALDAEQVNNLLDKYGERVPGLAAAAEAKIEAMIEAKEFDEALAFVEQLDDSYVDVNEARYQIAVKLLEEGELIKAYNLFGDLGDYSDSATMRMETTYRMILVYLYSLSTGTEPTPEGIAGAYTLTKGLGDYKETTTIMDTLLGLWLTYVMDPYYDGMAFAKSMNKTVKLSEEEKATMLDNILNIMMDLVWYEDGECKCYDTDALEALLLLMTEQFGPGYDDRADAFMSCLEYLCAPSRDILPTVDEIRTLWPIRSDTPAFCADGDPLLGFLDGSWVSEEGEELLKVVRTEENKFRLTYNMPREEASGRLRIEDMGVSLVDDDGKLVSRICTITIIGLDLIEVYNDADGQTYTLTRAEE